jgi:hypothetical protein
MGGSAAPGPETLVDTLVIGGRLEVGLDAGQVAGSAIKDTRLSHLRQADIYFDSRPSKDLRAFLRARLKESSGSGDPTAAARPCTSNCVATDLDEIWLKWDARDTVYFTLGKQHVKWGSGRIWNPTDFAAPSLRDPLASFDRRLGSDILKLHLPFEKSGANLYALVLYDSVSTADTIGGALRGEFAFGGAGEFAVSLMRRAHSPLRAGFDVSGGLGPVDLHVECAAFKNDNRPRFSGMIDPQTGQGPAVTLADQAWRFQAVAGVEHSVKYGDNRLANLGLEYFANQRGYSDKELEIYALALGATDPLSAGARYAAAYATLPTPLSFSETTLRFNWIANLSDGTRLGRLSASWSLMKDATIDSYMGRCDGQGELCLSLPESLGALAANPVTAPTVRESLNRLPRNKTQTTAGLSVSVKF